MNPKVARCIDVICINYLVNNMSAIAYLKLNVYRFELRKKHTGLQLSFFLNMCQLDGTGTSTAEC